MSKTITLRLTDKEYRQIVFCANIEHRPISNFITYVVISKIEESDYVDTIEMAQIKADHDLLKNLRLGHKDAQKMRGKFVK